VTVEASPLLALTVAELIGFGSRPPLRDDPAGKLRDLPSILDRRLTVDRVELSK
jgi:hypothetical protein